jgi:hypothetical protein
MAPRPYLDLTDEEIEELQADLVPSASVARLPGAQARGPSVEIGDVQMLGQDGDAAWLDELIARPEAAAPARPMLSAAGPGGTFDGEDTPQARELIKQRGMQVTQQPPPSDDDMLNALASERPATMPQLGADDAWLDELIGQESAAMDSEQAAEAERAAAPKRKSREEIILESLEPPSKLQGIAALIGDAFLGGDRVSQVQQRGRAYEQALAQARMQDTQAGERSDERAADRAMTDERLKLTLRGQDLASERAAENQELRRQLAEQTDRRIREEGEKSRIAAGERADKYAAARAAANDPNLTPEQRQAGVAAFLAQQANVPRAKALAFAAGKPSADTTPEELERLQVFGDQLGMLSPRKQEEVVVGGMRREGATPDALDAAATRKTQDPEKRLEARNDLLAQHAAIRSATQAWKEMSPQAKQVLARVGGGDGAMASMARSALLSAEDQARAAQVQALANALIKAQSGASVTANEWRRVAKEVGLPEDSFSVFNSPASIEAWLQKSVDGFRRVKASTETTYKGLFDEEPQ